MSVKEILAKKGITNWVFVDAGAKDSLDYIQVLEEMTELHAFEPNSEEVKKLEWRYKSNIFKLLKFNQQALSNTNGELNFYSTNHSSMSSLLRPDIENYEKHFGSYKEFDKWKDNISEKECIKVESVTLDTYIGTNLTIDYLKLDTQGSELSILEGARDLLKSGKINVIKAEVSTIPVYKDQALFSDIDIFLRGFGYELVDFKAYRNNYKPVLAEGIKSARYAPCGDAIYVLSPQHLSPENKLKSAIILLWQEYPSIAKNYLRLCGINEAESKELEKFQFRKSKVFKQLLINLTPPLILHWFKQLKQ